MLTAGHLQVSIPTSSASRSSGDTTSILMTRDQGAGAIIDACCADLGLLEPKFAEYVQQQLGELYKHSDTARNVPSRIKEMIANTLADLCDVLVEANEIICECHQREIPMLCTRPVDTATHDTILSVLSDTSCKAEEIISRLAGIECANSMQVSAASDIYQMCAYCKVLVELSARDSRGDEYYDNCKLLCIQKIELSKESYDRLIVAWKKSSPNKDLEKNICSAKQVFGKWLDHATSLTKTKRISFDNAESLAGEQNDRLINLEGLLQSLVSDDRHVKRFLDTATECNFCVLELIKACACTQCISQIYLELQTLQGLHRNRSALCSVYREFNRSVVQITKALKEHGAQGQEHKSADRILIICKEMERCNIEMGRGIQGLYAIMMRIDEQVPQTESEKTQSLSVSPFAYTLTSTEEEVAAIKMLHHMMSDAHADDKQSILEIRLRNAVEAAMRKHGKSGELVSKSGQYIEHVIRSLVSLVDGISEDCKEYEEYQKEDMPRALKRTHLNSIT